MRAYIRAHSPIYVCVRTLPHICIKICKYALALQKTSFSLGNINIFLIDLWHLRHPLQPNGIYADVYVCRCVHTCAHTRRYTHVCVHCRTYAQKYSNMSSPFKKHCFSLGISSFLTQSYGSCDTPCNVTVHMCTCGYICACMCTHVYAYGSIRMYANIGARMYKNIQICVHSSKSIVFPRKY